MSKNWRDSRAGFLNEAWVSLAQSSSSVSETLLASLAHPTPPSATLLLECQRRIVRRVNMESALPTQASIVILPINLSTFQSAPSI